MKKDLSSLLDLEAREHIAIVGAGGKTSLLFTLAEELRSKDRKVITTTTTKVRLSEAEKAPDLILKGECSEFEKKIRQGIEKKGHLFLGDTLLLSRKIKGIKPSVADMIFNEGLSDYLLVEADGAAGMSLKAHSFHEPVIPSTATLVIALMGLEVLGRPFSKELVFRAEIFQELTGINDGDSLTPEVISGLFNSGRGPFKGAPEGAQRIVFLNKLDLSGDPGKADALAQMMLDDPSKGIDGVIMGSLRDSSYRSKARA